MLRVTHSVSCFQCNSKTYCWICPPWHEFKNKVALEVRTLAFTAFHKQQFPHHQPPMCWFSRPHCFTACCVWTMKWCTSDSMPDFYGIRNLRLMPGWNRCIIVLTVGVRRMSIIGMNWWASFNVVMTCVVILTDTSFAVQVVSILLILSYLLFKCPSSSPPFTCTEHYKLCVPLLHCLNTRADSDFYMSSFDVSVGWIFDQCVRCSLIKMKLWEMSVVSGVCWAMTLCNLVDK
jgi:hypothetical protein